MSTINQTKTIYQDQKFDNVWLANILPSNGANGTINIGLSASTITIGNENTNVIIPSYNILNDAIHPKGSTLNLATLNGKSLNLGNSLGNVNVKGQKITLGENGITDIDGVIVTIGKNTTSDIYMDTSPTGTIKIGTNNNGSTVMIGGISTQCCFEVNGNVGSSINLYNQSSLETHIDSSEIYCMTTNKLIPAKRVQTNILNLCDTNGWTSSAQPIALGSIIYRDGKFYGYTGKGSNYILGASGWEQLATL